MEDTTVAERSHERHDLGQGRRGVNVMLGNHPPRAALESRCFIHLTAYSWVVANYQVLVQWSDGSAATGRRVCLGVGGGITPYVYTDRKGKAVISTSVSGTATVYVDGTIHGRMSPGTYVVTLRS